MAALALEIEHRVDHVLHHARAGERAVLGHMPDQNEGEAFGLGEADEFQRAGADLGDGARRGIERLMRHGLDRIDHQQRDRPGGRSAGGSERRRYILHSGRGGEFDRRLE